MKRWWIGLVVALLGCNTVPPTAAQLSARGWTVTEGTDGDLLRAHGAEVILSADGRLTGYLRGTDAHGCRYNNSLYGEWTYAGVLTAHYTRLTVRTEGCVDPAADGVRELDPANLPRPAQYTLDGIGPIHLHDMTGRDVATWE